jgi:hypothetical protein
MFQDCEYIRKERKIKEEKKSKKERKKERKKEGAKDILHTATTTNS